MCKQDLTFIATHGWVAIIAGGKGTRLFPLSHQGRPKQFVQLNEEETFIQATTKRFVDVGFKEEHIVVITTTDRQTELAKEQLCNSEFGVLSQNIIQIDERYGYVGAMHYASRAIYDLDPEAIVLDTASDQYIAVNENFKDSIVAAMDIARELMHVSIVGVKVTDPVTFTGCGHIMYEPTSTPDIREAIAFVEKPNLKLAKSMMREGKSICNTGINCWRADTILGVFGSQLEVPETEEQSIKVVDFMTRIIDLCSVYAIRGRFQWYDCGTLSSLYEIAPSKSRHKNVYRGGRIVREECSDSLIITPSNSITFIHGSKKAAVVQHIVSGKIVTVICSMEASHLVKEMVNIYNECLSKSLLMDNFQVGGAKNNAFHSASLGKEEAICGFIGEIEDASVSVERDPETDKIITSIKFN